MTERETLLANLPSTDPHQRVILVHLVEGRESRLELRHQTYGAGIGWCTHSSVPLEPAQAAELRLALGISSPKKIPASSTPLRVHRAESA